jgi:tetratricopeptide (TPR) repeat protein
LANLSVKRQAYYEARLVKSSGDERERYTLERLYHSICADEGSGLQVFQEWAEELSRYRLANRLRALLNDVNSYPLTLENSKLWKEYYNARLAHLEARFVDAEEVYQAIAENDRMEAKLRAYALCDWGSILCRRERLRQPGDEEKAVIVLDSSLKMGVATDVKIAMSWVYLSDIYIAHTNSEKALFYLDQAKQFFADRNDYSGLLAVLNYEQGIYGRQGNLRKVFGVDQEMWNVYIASGEPPYLRTHVSPSIDWIWAGRYAEAEKYLRAVLEVAASLQDQEYQCQKTRDLALCLALQGKYAEALVMAEEGLSLARKIGELDVSLALSLYGITCLKCGELNRAKENLSQSFKEAKLVDAHHEIGYLYLATAYEVLKDYEAAQQYYQLAHMKSHQLGHNYFECGSLVGMIRLKHALKNDIVIPPLWSEAEQLAHQYEYNDHFTFLYLTRGHLIWDDLLPGWESGFDSALHNYQLALIHALRFNRFLLDEILTGREEGTPIHPIIQNSLEHGEEGQRMLVTLQKWWKSGINDIGVPRPDTISPLPEGISLIDAERIARKREPGDGSQQRDVVEEINTALAMVD